MYKYLVQILGLAFGVSILFSASTIAVLDIEGVTEPKGVYCEINEVKLYAQTSEDCNKAGGTVTHIVTTTVKPAGDNPN